MTDQEIKDGLKVIETNIFNLFDDETREKLLDYDKSIKELIDNDADESEINLLRIDSEALAKKQMVHWDAIKIQNFTRLMKQVAKLINENA